MSVMILLFASLFMPAAAPAAGPQPAPAAGRADVAPECIEARTQHARGAGLWRLPLRGDRLDRLPAGRLELAVLRRVDGCVIPAVVREGIGASPAFRRPR